MNQTVEKSGEELNEIINRIFHLLSRAVDPIRTQFNYVS